MTLSIGHSMTPLNRSMRSFENRRYRYHLKPSASPLEQMLAGSLEPGASPKEEAHLQFLDLAAEY